MASDREDPSDNEGEVRRGKSSGFEYYLSQVSAGAQKQRTIEKTSAEREELDLKTDILVYLYEKDDSAPLYDIFRKLTKERFFDSGSERLKLKSLSPIRQINYIKNFTTVISECQREGLVVLVDIETDEKISENLKKDVILTDNGKKLATLLVKIKSG